jgi:hypothetical protein
MSGTMMLNVEKSETLSLKAPWTIIRNPDSGCVPLAMMTTAHVASIIRTNVAKSQYLRVEVA